MVYVCTSSYILTRLTTYASYYILTRLTTYAVIGDGDTLIVQHSRHIWRIIQGKSPSHVADATTISPNTHLCTQTHLWHNGKVLQVFSCNKCFKAKPYLKEHEKGHFTPNRFQCVSCGVFFKSRVDCSSNHAEHYHTQSKHQYSFDAPSKNSYCSIWWKWVCLKWPQMLMIYICQQLVVFLGFSDGHCLMCVTFKRLLWSVKNKDVVLMLSRLQRWWCGKC